MKSIYANLRKGDFWNLHKIIFQMRPNNGMFEVFLNFEDFFADGKSFETSTAHKKSAQHLGGATLVFWNPLGPY